jgi:rod shape-determining protein MreC
MQSAQGRLVLFGVALFICVLLMALSVSGILGPLESLISLPLGVAQSGASSLTNRVSSLLGDLSSYQALKRRNEELERALINFQQEIVELREIKADYPRLAALLQYRDANQDKQFLAATVINRDTTGLLRTITIDRGTRDGVRAGMPVVTELGLVGRVYRVAATSAQIQLVIDLSSFVNARLQSDSRVEGTVRGSASGDLLMTFIPLGARVNTGDSVVTSGIGGKFPRGLLLGQVQLSRLDDTRLFQEAQVRSLIDFNRLEIVLVITSFEPLDLANFATPTPLPGAVQ